MEVLRCFNTVFPLWSLRTSSNKEKKKKVFLTKVKETDKGRETVQEQCCSVTQGSAFSLSLRVLVPACYRRLIASCEWRLGKGGVKYSLESLIWMHLELQLFFLGDKIHLCSLSEPNSGFLSCSQWYDRLAELKGVQRENPAWRWRVYREWGWGSLEQYVHSIVTIFGDTSVWSFSFTK